MTGFRKAGGRALAANKYLRHVCSAFSDKKHQGDSSKDPLHGKHKPEKHDKPEKEEPAERLTEQKKQEYIERHNALLKSTTEGEATLKQLQQ